MAWFHHIAFWHWWIFAGGLLLIELFAPAFIFLWLAFAAAAVGFLLLVFPNIPSGAQLVLYGLLSLIALVAWWRQRKPGRPCG